MTTLRPDDRRTTTTTAHAPAARSGAPWRVLLAVTLASASASVVGGCAHVDRTRQTVNRLHLRGTRQVSEGDVTAHLATRESPRLPLINVRSPFERPAYFDEPTFRRDLRRIVRYYQARGYYDAQVTQSRVRPRDEGRAVDLDVTVREGPPTRVASVWLSGCEARDTAVGAAQPPIDPPISAADEDARRWRVPPRACERIRAAMQLRPGAVFSEEAFHADERLLRDILRDEGRAAARVEPQATVDPARRTAHVAYVLLAGPPARFGRIAFLQGARGRPARNGELPNGYPVGPAERAAALRPGTPYSRAALADIQRRLFALGAFGMVRIEERPHRCDSRGRCDEARDVRDPGGYVRVDLDVHVSPVRPFRLRFGAGVAADQLRSDVHLLVAAEHRNFLGGMRQLRIEDRPAVYFGSIFNNVGAQGFDLGNALTVELRQPGMWRGGNGVASLSWDFGPDPFNPGLTDRSRASAAVGVEHEFARELRATGYVRATRVDYYQSPLNGRASGLIDIDPLFLSQYRPASQTYVYFEQQVTWDRRDSAIATRRGTYVTALAQEGVPALGPYMFLRGALEARGYVPLGAGFVLAARAFVGAAVGFGNDENGWPVPQELRFYSGGANSNRGYAFNRVGPLAVSPGVNCTVQGAGTVPYYDPRCRGGAGQAPYSLYVQDHNAVADLRRVVSVGGTTLWEASVELRWYHGPLGLVLFFDTSDVGGWSAPAYNRNDPATAQLVRPDPIPDPMAVASRTPRLPGARQLIFGMDPHPSSGLGVRYVTPVGVVRLDIGLRLDDLGCSAFNNAIRAQNAATLGQPWYYVAPRPQCDVFGLPIALNLALGEAY